MSNTLRVSIPSTYDFYTEETEKARKKLVKEIESHNGNVEEYKAAQAKIKNSNPEDLSVEDIFDSAANGRFVHGLYNKALELDSKVSEFSKLHLADRGAERQRVGEAKTSKIKQIRDQLTGIGYTKERVHRNNQNDVNLFPNIHPDVIELRMRESWLSGIDRLKGCDRNALLSELKRLIARHTVTA